MKLRRAMVTMAATAVIAPLALLSAPGAFAEEGDTASPSASSSETGSSASPSDTGSPSASDSASETPSDTASPSQSDDSSNEYSSEQSPSSSSSESSTSTPSADEGKDEEDAFDPYEDCKSFELDEKLSATIEGLPNKIVAGSGWHDFEFLVENDSDADLKNVYIDGFMEYDDETDASLVENLAVIQVKEDGKWTNGFQDYYEDENGKKVNLSGSFVAMLDSLEKDSSATLELRVKVKSSAPAGSSFALSEAVYAGKDSVCYGNGDFYDVRILAAGTKPGGVGDAEPNGEKPSGVTDGTKPQGEAKKISGNLAETGSGSTLPMIGLVGGVALVAGAGAVFTARRRKTQA
ncbi:LAETG motif-containing sortase-dependent surface protein [Streptomyces bobili]|uniref:LAETG motif-containing sortase-dependent surface protein n=1 Tax=Streptomyces bobili TaxID=67280 RepID=UPI0033A69E1F